jgi:hypothetical protein
MADQHEKGCKKGFEAMPLTPVGARGALCLAHTRDHRMQLGELRPLREGESLTPGAKLLRLRESDGAYEEVPLGQEAKGGPALVNSAAYRAGWGRIFGGNRTPEVGQA